MTLSANPSNRSVSTRPWTQASAYDTHTLAYIYKYIYIFKFISSLCDSHTLHLFPPSLLYTKVQSVRLVCGAKLHPSFIVSFTFLAFLVVAPQICCFSAHPHPLGSAQSDHLSCHWNHLSYLMTLLISRLFAFTNVDRYILKYIVGVTFVILYVLLFVCTPPILAPSAWIHAFVIHSQPFVSTSLPSSPNVLYSMTIIYVCCYFFSVFFFFSFCFCGGVFTFVYDVGITILDYLLRLYTRIH